MSSAHASHQTAFKPSLPCNIFLLPPGFCAVADLRPAFLELVPVAIPSGGEPLSVQAKLGCYFHVVEALRCS